MTAAFRPIASARITVEAKALRLEAKAADAASIDPAIGRLTLSIPETGPGTGQEPGEVLIEIKAAAVNPSDAKAATGLMPYAIFPRTPGRDFAGVVIDGPAHLIGREVFGSSGDLGIRRDGTHASHLVVEAAAVVEKPAAITLDEAAGIGVPFVTALEGFRRAGMPKPGETVLILGVNGKVGQAAAQIATWRGARVIGVARRPEPYAGHAAAPIDLVDSSAGDVAARVLESTGGKGADIVFNTVGEPYYADAVKSLAKLGRQILIAATLKPVEFDIFGFYRGRHTYVGIDTLALSSIETADLLLELVPGFASRQLRPFPILASAVHPLERAGDAYRAVMGSSRDRVILRPGREG
ncbi:oxidoreductase [Skermanella stibiiresistens SB22]|uniref:Oxidoreductase n=1 Tax=Skermanella stibiiresistens SB22 TaxID=1385369 RepID=W9GWZ4_9PROT|nr:zinc-binding alcohol dehydrogenase family protein [Skermanella stibiiresistens]EWY38324.1 oxidoreductase [Skermanella stibiiresistens SB22]